MTQLGIAHVMVKIIHFYKVSYHNKIFKAKTPWLRKFANCIVWKINMYYLNHSIITMFLIIRVFLTNTGAGGLLKTPLYGK